MRLSRFLLLFLFSFVYSSCWIVPSAEPKSVWSDDVTTIELFLTGAEDFCGEMITFTYPMSGRRLTPRRIDLFKNIRDYTEPEPNRCNLPYTDFRREALVVNPGSGKAIHYATHRDACLYYKKFEGELRILSEQDFARILTEITPKRMGMLSYTRNETDAFYSREYDLENGPFGIALEGADPTTFHAYNDSYARDDRSVWNESRKIEGVDPKTFIARDHDPFSQDAKQIYFSGVALPGADVASIQILDGHYSKDAKSVYYTSKKIEGLDPSTFKVYAFSAYSVDQKYVVYDDQIVEGADVQTFSAPMYSSYGRDANAVYYHSRRLDLNVATFLELTYGYAKDASKVYHKGRLLNGVDAPTFEVERCYSFRPVQDLELNLKCAVRAPSNSTTCYAKDKNFRYIDGVPQP
ncbi:MAG TPA: DKNYY domain-containing protein [Oligoflexus sp.]|uniref:DKNYY domain-containing protein n=1 Tax=Oligoflexus sp. TaxID=1971216 RepID=UPI002D6B55F7|nr:DKNYY domain-containing protein [Oligoflexus sp.]HYX37692.1 DKNYY domain-containing protein [Oligoflexus sp.]